MDPTVRSEVGIHNPKPQGRENNTVSLRKRNLLPARHHGLWSVSRFNLKIVLTPRRPVCHPAYGGKKNRTAFPKGAFSGEESVEE